MKDTIKPKYVENSIKATTPKDFQEESPFAPLLITSNSFIITE